MGIKDRATKAAAGAVGIAVATSGLSSCNDNGAVDPLPPPLQCNDVGEGQMLYAEAVVSSDDTVAVTISQGGFYPWSVDSVIMNSGGTLHGLTLPDEGTLNYGQLRFWIVFDADSTSATFTVFAKTAQNEKTCEITRQFTVTAAGSIASVTQLRVDDLPLFARQPASIVLIAREGRVATIEARTAYNGEKQLKWSVSDGDLTAHADDRATWALPAERGIYQAEVVMDYGPDGVAFDALSIEVL